MSPFFHPGLVVLLMTVCPGICQEYVDPAVGGSWQVVAPHGSGAADGISLGMQTVHAVLLPSGRLLLVSGSSWRNQGPISTSCPSNHPDYNETAFPDGGQGMFQQRNDPFRVEKTDDYFQIVNNAAVYDPDSNAFYRIPHPVPVLDPQSPDGSRFAPSDLFCTGHMHLPDGNVLFVGGTQYYHPFRTGHRSTFLFDWQQDAEIDWKRVDWRLTPNVTGPDYPWRFAGFMKRGRWYASVVPTMDGRLVVFAGFTDKNNQTYSNDTTAMYEFENNDMVEFFDPRAFNATDPQAAWRDVSVKNATNGPFTNLINPQFKPTESHTANCPARCEVDNRFDVFKLYEQAYLVGKRRIFLTREGDFVSARTPDTAFMRRTKSTYYLEFGGSRGAPEVTFKPGPPRQADVTSYGTTVLDPNSGRILLFGGQPTSAGSFLYKKETPRGDQRYAGGRGSRKLEQFYPARHEPNGGHWTLEPNFLGDNPQDDRTMHYALLLPTAQILIINGANYDFFGAVRYPLLLTPRFHAATGLFLGYEKEYMSESTEERLYHNVALLLPDGRIWTSGGGKARATNTYVPLKDQPLTPHDTLSGQQPKPNTSNIDLAVEMYQDGGLAKGQKGSLMVPTETWVAEIFYPPYMFIDGDRQPRIKRLEKKLSNSSVEFIRNVSGKMYYLLKSTTEYTVQLDNLPAKCAWNARDKLVLMKLGSATHGWDGGQRLINLKFSRASPTGTELQLQTPDAMKALIVPSFYMMFYVDCMGKPSRAQMVQFDDGPNYNGTIGEPAGETSGGIVVHARALVYSFLFSFLIFGQY